MFGMQTLDIGIGLVTIYLFLSFACTAFNEAVLGALMDLRSRNLKNAINKILGQTGIEGLDKKFLTHPLIESLCKKPGKDTAPSYIAPKTFSLVLIDLLKNEVNKKSSVKYSEMGPIIDRLPPHSDLKKTLSLLFEDSKEDDEEFRKKIESWYDNVMDRIIGWYKKRIQRYTLILALGIAVLANVDTFEITNALSSNPALRSSLVAQAQDLTKKLKDTDPATYSMRMDLVQNKLSSLGIPIGWTTKRLQKINGAADWIKKIMGILITAFAISLGAPFWFDLLNKMINIRAAGQREKTQSEKDAEKEKKENEATNDKKKKKDKEKKNDKKEN